MFEKKSFQEKLFLQVERHSLLIYLMILLVVAAFCYVYILQPKWQALRFAGIFNLSAQRAELAELEKYLENLESRQVAYDKLNREDLARIQAVLPLEKEIPALLVQLEDIAQENNLTLLKVNFAGADATASQRTFENDSNPMVDQTSWRELSISLQVGSGGSYNNFKDFLDSLENNLRLMDIIQLDFEPGSSIYNLKLKTYYLP